VILAGCASNRTVANRGVEVATDGAAPPASSSVSQPTLENSTEVIGILEKHIAAIGGRDAQNAIKTVETERELELFNVVRKTYEIRDKTTNRFYSKTEDPNGIVETGFDGKRVWQKTPFFRGYLPDTDPNAKLLSRKRPELYEYKETDQKFLKLPNEVVDGKQCIVLQTRNADLDPLGRELLVKYYFDPDTFLLRRTVRGAEVTQTITFDDYREVSGTFVPFASKSVNPNVTMNSRINRIQYNVSIDPARFEYEAGALSSPSGGAAEKPAQALGAGALLIQRSATGQSLTEKERLDTFELVWSTVNDTYWDPTFGGVDWKAVHDKYLPQVKVNKGSDEYYALLNQMLAELDRSHLKVLKPEDAPGLHSKASDLRNGSVGLDLRWLNGELVVFDTKKGFPADKAGIKRGFRILRINGKDPNELLANYKEKHRGFPLRDEIEHVRAAVDELSGSPNTEITLEVADLAGGKPLRLTRQARPLDQAVEFETRTLEGNVGYIRFSSFFGDVLVKTGDALRRMRHTAGLIMDLRGNPGGVGDLTGSIASLLCSQPGNLGSSSSRYGTRQNTYPGTGSDAYPGRVVILVDEMTGSAAEVFSAGLQENKRATIIGAATAGAALPSMMKMLPTGGALQHAIANFKTPNGTTLEGRGVIPDVPAKPSREALLQGRDPALDAAIWFITSGDRATPHP
jgi:carboxyl-terminal processing protease